MINADACWTTQPLVVCDFETTGVDVLTCGVVSVAVARFEQGQCVGKFYSLCNPRMEIPAESTAIHGIKDSDVAQAPALHDLAGELFAIAKDAIPCGYNGMSFDRPILHRHVTGMDCPLFDPGWAWIDPLAIVRVCDRWERGQGRRRLENTCKRHGIELEGAHNAQADAIATGYLLYALLRKGHVKPCALGKLLLHQEKVRAQQEAEFKEWLFQQQERERRQKDSA